jgi:hypothetical protein
MMCCLLECLSRLFPSTCVVIIVSLCLSKVLCPSFCFMLPFDSHISFAQILSSANSEQLHHHFHTRSVDRPVMVAPSKKRVQRYQRASQWTSGISWACCLCTIILIIIINSAGISVNEKNINGESYAILLVCCSISPEFQTLLTLRLSLLRLIRKSRVLSLSPTHITFFPTGCAQSQPAS